MTKHKQIALKSRPQWSLLAGIVAGPIFITAMLIEGATRASYNPLRHPGSSLAIGPSGWTQTTNFLVAGLLILLFAMGLWKILRRQPRKSIMGPLLIGWLGIGLFGAGLFVTDPVSGYPPGTPDLITQPTAHGQLHDLSSLGVFVGLPLACLVFSRYFFKQKQRRWAIYSLLSGLGMFTAFVFANVAFTQTALVDYGGLFQRLSLIVGLGWLTALAMKFFRQTKRD